jgi:uncharacterized phage protein gp47/JayE
VADLPTFQDFFRIARDEILARNSRLTLEVIERPGSDANVMVAAGAAMADEVTGQLTRVAAGLFLDSARGDQLDRLVFDRLNMPRKSASPSFGSVAFRTTVPAAAAFAIPKGAKLSTPDGKQFVTTQSATFAYGATGPVYAAVQSVLAGASQQAAIGTITSLRDTITGAPADLTVTNLTATAGGADEEGDDNYRARARLFFGSVRRGTAAAVRSAALESNGVQSAQTFEYVDAFGRPVKAAQLVISDPFTSDLVNVTPTPATYQAQSQLLAAQVFSNLSDTRPIGIYIDVMVAQVVMQPVILGLSFQAGVDADSVALQARSRVVQIVNALSPGEALTTAAIIAGLQVVPGLIVGGGEVLSPPGDVLAETLQVLRTSLGMVVASTMQPDRALQGSANPDGV